MKFKQLFCRHIFWEALDNTGKDYIIWKCGRCGKYEVNKVWDSSIFNYSGLKIKK